MTEGELTCFFPLCLCTLTSSRSTSGLSLLDRAQTLDCCVTLFQPLPFSDASCSDDYIKENPRILPNLLSRGLALNGCSSAGSFGLGNAPLVALAGLYLTSSQSKEKGLGL